MVGKVSMCLIVKDKEVLVVYDVNSTMFAIVVPDR